MQVRHIPGRLYAANTSSAWLQIQSFLFLCVSIGEDSKLVATIIIVTNMGCFKLKKHQNPKSPPLTGELYDTPTNLVAEEEGGDTRPIPVPSEFASSRISPPRYSDSLVV